uniref:Uncharacterized protein n=1 Tax=Anopheles culicifacies TaxID=139723 RepID=A0A182MQT2_9DIPT
MCNQQCVIDERHPNISVQCGKQLLCFYDHNNNSNANGCDHNCDSSNHYHYGCGGDHIHNGSIISQRLDDRSSHNGRRRSSSISGLSRGSLAGAIINDRDNLDISAVASSLRDFGGTGGGPSALAAAVGAPGGAAAAAIGGTNSATGPGTTTGAAGVSRHGSDARREISNSVQAQIERMFTDVAKENGSSATANVQSFSVRCLGSLPLKDKVTSLVGLQEPLRQLYLSGAGHGVSLLCKNTRARDKDTRTTRCNSDENDSGPPFPFCRALSFQTIEFINTTFKPISFALPSLLPGPRLPNASQCAVPLHQPHHTFPRK